MAIKSAKPGIPVSRVDQCTLARDRRAATSKKRKSEQDIAKLTGLTRNGLSLLPVRFRQLLDDVQFDLCDTPVNHSQRSGCRTATWDERRSIRWYRTFHRSRSVFLLCRSWQVHATQSPSRLHSCAKRRGYVFSSPPHAYASQMTSVDSVPAMPVDWWKLIQIF